MINLTGDLVHNGWSELIPVSYDRKEFEEVMKTLRIHSRKNFKVKTIKKYFDLHPSRLNKYMVLLKQVGAIEVKHVTIERCTGKPRDYVYTLKYEMDEIPLYLDKMEEEVKNGMYP